MLFIPSAFGSYKGTQDLLLTGRHSLTYKQGRTRRGQGIVVLMNDTWARGSPEEVIVASK